MHWRLAGVEDCRDFGVGEGGGVDANVVDAGIVAIGADSVIDRVAEGEGAGVGEGTGGRGGLAFAATIDIEGDLLGSGVVDGGEEIPAVSAGYGGGGGERFGGGGAVGGVHVEYESAVIPAGELEVEIGDGVAGRLTKVWVPEVLMRLTQRATMKLLVGSMTERWVRMPPELGSSWRAWPMVPGTRVKGPVTRPLLLFPEVSAVWLAATESSGQRPARAGPAEGAVTVIVVGAVVMIPLALVVTE